MGIKMVKINDGNNNKSEFNTEINIIFTLFSLILLWLSILLKYQGKPSSSMMINEFAQKTHWIILMFTVLYYAILCYAILCYSMLFYASLCYSMLHYAAFALLCCVHVHCICKSN